MLPAPVVRVLVRLLGYVQRLKRGNRGVVRRSAQRLTGANHGTVTVVVTAYNDARFLNDCLCSLLHQTYADWRCIVVDDASTDDGVAIASRFARMDERFTVVRHRRNSGLSAARNTGLMRTVSPWVCFLDADDFLLDSSLADRVSVLAGAAADVAGVFSGSVTVAEGARLGELPARLDGDLPSFEDLLTTAGSCPFPAHAPLLRTSVMHQAGGFDELMRSGGEDWDAWVRLMRSGYQFLSSGSRTVAYRMKRGSMVGRDPQGHLAAGRSLIDSVHRPARDDELVPGGPAALREPIAAVIRAIEHARRSLSFAPLIAVDDPAAARELIEAISPSTWLLLDRREDIFGRVRAAAQRAQQIHPSASVSAEVLEAQFASWIAHARQAGSPIEAASRLPGPLVVASHADEAMSLISDHQDSTWLLLDREEGDHGVADALRDSGVRTVALSNVVLGQRLGGLPSVLVGDHPTPLASRLADDPSVGLVELLGDDDLMTIEEYPELRYDGVQLSQLADIHAGERAVIIGNGPSLGETDLSLLADEVTFGVNGIFYAREKMGFDPTYYVVEDSSFMRENLAEVRAQQAKLKFFPSMYRSLYAQDDAIFFNLNRGFYEGRSPNAGFPRFSVDVAQRVYAGQSVTYVNLQLAFYMGFETVVLVGVDFDYVIPEGDDRNGEVLTSRGPDRNHFHPDYFGPGKTWKDPRLDRVALNYSRARAMFEADGRRVVNATVGGRLEIFPRVELAKAVGR